MITNKAAYMDYKTWERVVKVVEPGVRKITVRNVDFVCSILFSTYLTLHLCPSKVSIDNLRLPKVVSLPQIWWALLTYYGLYSHTNVTEGLNIGQGEYRDWEGGG